MLNCYIIIAAGSMTSSFGCISEMINSGAFEKYRCSAPVFIRGSGKLYFTKLPHSFLISCQGLKPSIIFLPGYTGTFHDEEGEPVMVEKNPGVGSRWTWVPVPILYYSMCHLKQVTSLLVSAHPSGSCCSYLMYEGFVGASHFPDRKNWRGRCSDTPPQCFTEWWYPLSSFNCLEIQTLCFHLITTLRPKLNF